MRATWLKRGAWASTGRIVSAALTFGQSILLTRILPPSEAGFYFLMLSVSWGLSLFAQWGAATQVVRQIGESNAQGHPERAGYYARIILRRSTARAVVLGLLSLLTPVFISQFLFAAPLSIALRGLLAALVLVTTLQNVVPEIFRGFHRIDLASIFLGPLPNFMGLLLALLLYIFKIHIDLTVFILAMTIGASVALLPALFSLARVLPRALAPDQEARAQVWAQATPIAITQIATYFLSQADILSLGSAVPKDQIALYGAAQRLSLVVLMPMTIVGSILVTKIAELWTQKRVRDLQDVMSAGVMFSFAPAAALLLLYSICGHWFLSTAFGAFYSQAYALLMVLTSFQLVHIFGGLSGYALLMAHQQRAMMWASIVSGVVSIIASFVLSRIYGAMGAAVGVGSGLSLQTVWMIIRVRTHLNLRSTLDPVAFVRIMKGGWLDVKTRLDRSPGL